MYYVDLIYNLLCRYYEKLHYVDLIYNLLCRYHKKFHYVDLIYNLLCRYHEKLHYVDLKYNLLCRYHEKLHYVDLKFYNLLCRYHEKLHYVDLIYNLLCRYHEKLHYVDLKFYNLLCRYHEKLHYVDLTFQTDPDATKPLTRENLDIHTTNEYNGNGIWSSPHDKDSSEMSSLLHNRLSVKDSVESDFPDAVTDSTYIHAKDIEYCELFPTSSKSGCKNGGEDSSAQFGTVTTRHLLSWSFQIAKGMEYLASKRVSLCVYSLSISFYIFCCSFVSLSK